MQTEPLVFDSGENVTLTTTIQSKPKPQVSWYKDDKLLRETKNIQLKSVADTYTLIIKDASHDDSGNYKCEAKNDFGTSYRTFDVNIEGNSL